MSFNAKIEHHFTHAHESHKISTLNKVQVNLGRKHLTTPDFINDKNIQPTFSRKSGEIQVKGFGW